MPRLRSLLFSTFFPSAVFTSFLLLIIAATTFHTFPATSFMDYEDDGGELRRLDGEVQQDEDSYEAW